MIVKDYSDSIPCYLPRRQFVTFVYSQPQNSVPSYLADLLAKKEPEFVPKKPESQFASNGAQMHQVEVSIGKQSLVYDVPVGQITEFLRRNSIRSFISTNIFLSPYMINIALDRATGNFLNDGGQAQCLDSGILFARDLVRGEKFYMLVMHRTPLDMNRVRIKLGRK